MDYRETKEILESLVKSISSIPEVQSIGMSGGKSPLPAAGKGDIDIFVYCCSIPESAEREASIKDLGNMVQGVRFNIFQGGHWGLGDFVMINGIETWLMYFTVNEVLEEIGAVLDGGYPDKLDNYYYPVGRCSMINSINILYDRNGFLSSLKERLHEYPDRLAGILIQYHLGELEDTEDLERAAGRKDILFYHFALDIALDHFLQALFALNRVYFPSRKRTIEHIDNFVVKPEGCVERLLDVIRLGGSQDTIVPSYELWSELVNELKKICPGQ